MELGYIMHGSIHTVVFFCYSVLLILCGALTRIGMFFFSDSSLEVLLQHLSLQDVDARDNEVFRIYIQVNIYERS